MSTESGTPQGLSLTLSSEHEMIRQTARDFAQHEIAPIAAEFDESGEFPYETIMKMGALGLMGIEVPEGREGRSLRPLAEGRAAGKWRGYIAVESQNGRMIRTERFKYCLYDSGQRREQLTDMRNDPGEMNNLAADEKYKDVLDRHRRLLRRWVKKIDDRIAADYLDVT